MGKGICCQLGAQVDAEGQLVTNGHGQDKPDENVAEQYRWRRPRRGRSVRYDARWRALWRLAGRLAVHFHLEPERLSVVLKVSTNDPAIAQLPPVCRVRLNRGRCRGGSHSNTEHLSAAHLSFEARSADLLVAVEGFADSAAHEAAAATQLGVQPPHAENAYAPLHRMHQVPHVSASRASSRAGALRALGSSWQWGRLFGRGGILTGEGMFTIRTRARKR